MTGDYRELNAQLVNDNEEEFLSLLDEEKSTPPKRAARRFHVTAIVGFPEYAAELVDHGIDVDAENARGWTALARAIKEYHWETARVIAEGGADVTGRDPQGNPLLKWPIWEGKLALVEAHLENGADPTLAKEGYPSPLESARENDNEEALAVLEEYGPYESDEPDADHAARLREREFDDEVTATVDECWDALEAWLEDHHDEGTTILNPPASDADIGSLEATLGVELPDSFVQFYRRHDGQGSGRALLERYSLLSVDEIERYWARWTNPLEDGEFEGRMDDYPEDPDEGIRDVWWNDEWIPFGVDPTGNVLCLDLDPGPGGTRGQVISVWNDTSARGLRGESFASWFEGLIGKLDAGEYVYASELHSLMARPEEVEHHGDS